MLRDLTIKQEIPSFIHWVSKLTDKVFNSPGCSGERKQLSWQQLSLLKSLHENKYNIVKGFRQCGLSTMLRLNALYNLLYKECDGNYNILFISDRMCSADCEKKLFIELLYQCDEYITLISKNNNSIRLKFDERNINVQFISQHQLKERKGLTEKVDLINIDNAGWVQNKDISDSIALLAKQTKADVNIASTPNGESGLFYETWRDSLAGTAPFKMHSMKWYLDDRFKKGLKGSSGLESYNIDNIGMLFEAFERGDMITNDWYEERKTMLGANASREIDGEFV